MRYRNNSCRQQYCGVHYILMSAKCLYHETHLGQYEFQMISHLTLSCRISLETHFVLYHIDMIQTYRFHEYILYIMLTFIFHWHQSFQKVKTLIIWNTKISSFLIPYTIFSLNFFQIPHGIWNHIALPISGIRNLQWCMELALFHIPLQRTGKPILAENGLKSESIRPDASLKV